MIQFRPGREWIQTFDLLIEGAFQAAGLVCHYGNAVGTRVSFTPLDRVSNHLTLLLFALLDNIKKIPVVDEMDLDLPSFSLIPVQKRNNLVRRLTSQQTAGST